MNNLFDFYPDEIFKPLASKNRWFYWRVIAELHDAFFGDDADAVDSMIDDSEVKRAIEDILIDTGKEINEDGESNTPLTTDVIKSNTTQIFNYLRDSGWLKTDKNGLKIGVYMSPRIANLVQLLMLSRYEMSEQLGSHVFLLRSVLQSLLAKQSSMEDVSTALRGAVNQARAVSQLMNALSAEMLELYEKIGEVSELSLKADLFFNHFIDSPAFKVLNSLNGDNHPYRYKAEILKMVDQLEYSSIKDKVLDLYSESDEAEKLSDQYFNNLRIIRKIFSNVENLKSRVDRNHGKLVKRVNESIRYQRRYGNGIGVYETVLSELKAAKLNSHDLQLDSLVVELQPAYSDVNFRLPAQKKPPIESLQKVRKQPSKRDLLRSKLKRELRKQYRMNDEKIIKFLEENFVQSKSTELLSELMVTDDIYDYICFTTLRRLCNPSPKNLARYREVFARYRFTIISDHPTWHDACQCRPFIINEVNRV